MSTTIKDFGHNSERFGNIGFYYAFPIKFWFGQSMLHPEDVLSWCRDNCSGYYKVTCYTHEDSVKVGGVFTEKYVFIDKIYLSSEEDAALIKLMFDVREQQVKRPKLKRAPKRHGVAPKLTTEQIAEASRALAAKKTDTVSTAATLKAQAQAAGFNVIDIPVVAVSAADVAGLPVVTKKTRKPRAKKADSKQLTLV